MYEGLSPVFAFYRLIFYKDKIILEFKRGLSASLLVLSWPLFRPPLHTDL